MLYILLGPDDFSKQPYITSLAKMRNAEVMTFFSEENLPSLSQALMGDLFSKPKTLVLYFLPSLPTEELDKVIASQNLVVISLGTLDKRKKETKELLSNKQIIVKDFPLPHGKDLNQWITERVKALGGNISAAATDLLAIKLGRDDAKETKFGGRVVATEEIYNLWQTDSEVRKLLAYAGSRDISETDVNELTIENREVDVFDLTNALADNQKQIALDLMGRFLKQQTGADEKGAIIQLNALLSEQFRSVAITQDFLFRKVSEGDILETTGWKSGRLFVMKKIALRYPQNKITELLKKLEALDQELKSTQTPPRVLLDLIVSQLLT